MSDLYRTNTSTTTNEQAKTQNIAEQKEQEINTHNNNKALTEENKKRFAQKMKGEKTKKNSANDSKTSEKDILQKQQKESTLHQNLYKDREHKEETSEQKANAILQGLHGGASATQTSATASPDKVAPTSGTDRLFDEFQAVADRVLQTNTNLQQGGSIRLQLNNSILPGTSVTFAMVEGALHATFSGTNKNSLDKIRSHKEKLTEHVREHSGVAIVVDTKKEDEQQGEL